MIEYRTGDILKADAADFKLSHYKMLYNGLFMYYLALDGARLEKFPVACGSYRPW